MIDGDGYEEQIQQVIQNARSYMETSVRGFMAPAVVDLCKNQYENCAWWAVMGECEGNPECT